MLVGYAGNDPTEIRIPVYDGVRTKRRTQYKRPGRVYDLFLLGFDTFDLAKRYGVREATILRWINAERSKRNILPSPYVVRP